MPSLEWKISSVDDVTKALGALAIAAYAVGYIVLSYFLSNYGFSPLSPFRSRVLETGVSAMVLFAIPASIGSTVASIPRREMHISSLFIIRLLCIPTLCGMVCLSPGFIDDLPQSFAIRTSPAKLITIFCLVVILAIGLVWILIVVAKWLWLNYHNKKLPVIITLLLTACASIYENISPYKGPMHHRIYVWFVVISIITCLVMGPSREIAIKRKVKEKINEAEELDQEINWALEELCGEANGNISQENLLVRRRNKLEQDAKDARIRLDKILPAIRSDTSLYHLEPFVNVFGVVFMVAYGICAIGAYVNWIFPFIPFKLGGGEIIQITVHQKGSNQASIQGGMLDQTDQGIYIVPLGRDKGLFIPMDKVDLIYFGNDSASLQTQR